MFNIPRNLQDITLEAVKEFVFSDANFSGQSNRERVRKMLLRWNPDKFGPYIERVPAGEKGMVLEAAGLVTCHLNTLKQGK